MSVPDKAGNRCRNADVESARGADGGSDRSCKASYPHTWPVQPDSFIDDPCTSAATSTTTSLASGRIGTKKHSGRDWPTEVARAAFALRSGGDSAQFLLATPRFPSGCLNAAIAASGCKLSCDVVAEVLQSFFYAKGPLHDGAVLIYDGCVVAARVPPYISWQVQASGQSVHEYSAQQFCTSFYPTVAAVVVADDACRTVSFFFGNRIYTLESANELAEQIQRCMS